MTGAFVAPWWGAVLTGGRSSRMGSNKALVEVDGVAMARRVGDVLRRAGAAEVACVGGDLPALAALGLTAIADPHQGLGPLAGIVAALRWAQSAGVDTVAVVATDLPWLAPELLCELVETSRRFGRVAMARGQQLEPLVAAWPCAVADDLAHQLDHGLRAVHRAVTDPIELSVFDVGQLTNLNSPDQLGWRPGQ